MSIETVLTLGLAAGILVLLALLHVAAWAVWRLVARLRGTTPPPQARARPVVRRSSPAPRFAPVVDLAVERAGRGAAIAAAGTRAGGRALALAGGALLAGASAAVLYSAPRLGAGARRRTAAVQSGYRRVLPEIRRAAAGSARTAAKTLLAARAAAVSAYRWVSPRLRPFARRAGFFLHGILVWLVATVMTLTSQARRRLAAGSPGRQDEQQKPGRPASQVHERASVARRA